MDRSGCMPLVPGGIRMGISYLAAPLLSTENEPLELPGRVAEAGEYRRQRVKSTGQTRINERSAKVCMVFLL